MKKKSHLLTKYLHSSLLGFLLFLTLTLILALVATPAHSADVTLAWDPNSEPDLAGYKVYYKTGSSGPPYDGTGATEGDSPIDVGNVTEFTLHDLTDGVTYFFVVTAHDTEGLESGYSNEVNTVAGNMPPNGVIDTPPGDQTIEEGDSVDFTGTGTDPEGDYPLTYLWDFDGGAPDSTDEDPGAITFTTAGTYNVTLTVTDSLGLSDPTPDTVKITVTGNTPPPSPTLSGVEADEGAGCFITTSASF